MRIERIQVDSFGRLTGFDTGAQALGPLVLRVGGEAGIVHLAVQANDGRAGAAVHAYAGEPLGSF